MFEHFKEMKDNGALLDPFKPKWYWEQMKGWSLQAYMVWMLGIGTIFGITIASPINFLSIMTLLAGLLGFTTVCSTTSGKRVNGVFGLVSALIYVYVAFNAKNYNDIILQLSYIVLLDLPVLMSLGWTHINKDNVKSLWVKGNSKLTSKHLSYTLLFFLVAFGLLYLWETKGTDSPRPIIDSFASSIGITGAVLTTLRFKDTYFFWAFQGVMSCFLWGITFLQGGSSPVLLVVYLLYLLNDVLAFTKSPWFSHKSK